MTSGYRITGTRAASGPVTGLPVGKLYVYGGDKPIPAEERGVIQGPKGGAKVRRQQRLDRTALYARLRDEGATHDEARQQIRVERKTGARYKADWLAVPCGHDFTESCTRCTERRDAQSRARKRNPARVAAEEAQAS